MTTSTIDDVLLNLNTIISLIISERDRLRTLLAPSLPDAVAVWDVIPESVRIAVRAQAVKNLTESKSVTDGVIEGIGAL